jgi:hypothetical protein
MLSSPAVIEMILREDAANAAYLGEAAETEILARARAWLGHADEAGTRLASPSSPPADPLSERLGKIGAGLSETPYFVGLRALGRLAVYRASAALEWLLVCLPLIAASLVDGVVMRAVKTRTLVYHSPVVYGIGLWGSLASLAGLLVMLVVPASVHPLALAALLLLLAFSLGAAASNFHRLR